MDISKFKVYVGTARGFLLFTADKLDDIKSTKSEETSQITALTFGKKENEILVGHQNGSVQIYNTLENKYDKISNLKGEGPVVGLASVGKSLIIGKQDGIINIWKRKKNDYFDISLDEKGTLNSMVYNGYRDNIIGTGGEFNDFKLWDIECQKCIFKAKSLGHDYLNLPIPTSVRGITFFPENQHFSGCCTKEGHVLLYDDRAQRRPVMKFQEAKASYTSISCVYKERQCLVGTTRGYMQLLDLNTGKCLKTFKTFTGSITGIICDPVEPYVATTCLDRHLRIHNIETKELVHKIYMKQNLTSLIMKPIVKEEPTEAKEVEVIDEEYENIFTNMETVSEEDLKKQKRKSEIEAVEKTKVKRKVKKKKLA